MAMAAMLDLLAGSSASHNIRVPGELVIRGSSAPPKHLQD
jgi:DNA-binding LacI/PurR family transcriptional regulator